MKTWDKVVGEVSKAEVSMAEVATAAHLEFPSQLPDIADPDNTSSLTQTLETQDMQDEKAISVLPVTKLGNETCANNNTETEDHERTSASYRMVSTDTNNLTSTHQHLARPKHNLTTTETSDAHQKARDFMDDNIDLFKQSHLLEDEHDLSYPSLALGYRRLLLREQLEANDWSEHVEGTCSNPECRGRYTYRHGVFSGTDTKQAPPLLTVEEAQLLASPMRFSIWENFDLLAAITAKYELLIQRRWTKKSKNKRRQLLQAAWTATSHPPPPPMAEKHRPEVQFLYSEKHCENLKHGCDCRPAVPVDSDKLHLFFWPRLNLEDLTKTEPVLLLLNARGRHSPATFAFADLEPVHFGLKLHRIQHPPFLDGYNMLFTGQEGPQTYGQLVSWLEDDEAFVRLHKGRDTSPGEGLWILGIQDRLLALPTEPEPPLPTANGHAVDNATYLVTTRTEIEYHLPAKLDTRRLQNLIASKLAEAEDTLWSLREDPGFFAMTLMDVYQGRPEHLRDTHHRPHLMTITSYGKDRLMFQVVRDIWAMYFPAIERWELLLDVVTRLAELKDRLFDKADPPIRPEDDLPPELAMAIYTAMTQLKSVTRNRLEHHYCRARCSPALRGLFLRVAGPKTSRHQLITSCVETSMSGVAVSRETEEYLSMVQRMDLSTEQGFGLYNCIEEIERITSTPAGSKLISSVEAAELSEFSILSECMRQLELFLPWAATFEADMVDRTIAKKLHEIKDSTRKRQLKLQWKPPIAALELGAKVAKLPYPVGKAANQANVDAMRTAEACLDDFWSTVLAELKGTDLLTERVAKILLSTNPERTPMWVAPTKTEAQPTAAHSDDQWPRPFDAAFGGPRETFARGFRRAKLRVKVKSHGMARPPQAEPVINEAGPEKAPQLAPPTIEVDSRTMKVIESMFFTPSPDAVQGEVAWTEFTYMMHSVGFAVEKLMGSAWQFTPGPRLTEHGFTRGIQCHEPHPKSRLSFVGARRFGRRLTRAYGWCADTFVVRAV